MTIFTSKERAFATSYFDFYSTPQIPPSTNVDTTLLEAIKNQSINAIPINDHLTERLELLNKLRSSFKLLQAYISIGRFHLVLYGYGTKIDILDEFTESCLNGFDVYTFYGHVEELQKIPLEKDRNTAIIIHNVHRIKDKSLLLEWIDAKKARLVMSIDGNVPREILSKDTRVLYFDFTTMTSYTVDEVESLFRKTHDTNCMNLVNTDTKASKNLNEHSTLKRAQFVLSSLTTNSRQVFKILAMIQLHQKVFPTEQELYRTCADQLIVSSEISFHALLGEFIDHELVSIDEEDCKRCRICLDDNCLKELLETYKDF